MLEPAYWEQAALELLARDLLLRRPGDRLPTVARYQDQLGIGSGTVQARLRALASVGAVTLRSRGHRGTFVVDRDLSKLWSLSRLGPVRGVMPLPEGFEPVALAAVLRRQFEVLKIPLELLYLHGSRRRIGMVQEGNAHFAVTSGPAAAEVIGADSNRWMTLEFGPETYHRSDTMSVLIRPHLGTDDSIRRIAVNPASLDHALLTRAEFPAEDGYDYVEYPPGRLPAVVAEGLVDAAIWHRAALAIPLSAVGIMIRPLHRLQAIAVANATGNAVLVARLDCPEVASLLREIDVSATRAVQEEIRRSETLPLY